MARRLNRFLSLLEETVSHQPLLSLDIPAACQLPTVTTSPPPAGAPQALMQSVDTKQQSTDVMPNAAATAQDGQTTSQDMTALEFCQAFERQLLDLDDLAAFMGGRV